MMRKNYFIGVDSGSQSTKVLIFNEIGEVICSEAEPISPMLHRKPGYVEHPDDDLWDSLKAVLKKLMKKFDGDIKDIKGVGLCTIRCCRVFMKADGTLQAPVMSWMDVRSYEKFENLDEIAYTCPTSGYITHRLTGELKDTVSNAFQWQFPSDLDTWDWSTDEKYFNEFNIPKEKLFKLQMPGTILGYITQKASEETGLPVGLPVVATANDKAVEALGAGLIEKNVGLLSLGTYICGMVQGEKNEKDPKNYWVNLSCVPNQFLYECDGIRRGMWHISWFKSIVGEEYAKKAKSMNISVEELLEKEAVKTPVGSDGLLTIPDWLAPATQLYRKGVMIGFDERHTVGHMYRSILEGIAMTLTHCFYRMVDESGRKLDKIILSGGGSNSDLFMQIFADICGVKTVRNTVNGAASLGSAICVAVATGVYSSFDEATKKMVTEKDEFIPNMENHEKYKKIKAVAYNDLPGMLEDSLKTIYNAYN